MNATFAMRTFPIFAAGFALFYAPAYAFTNGNASFPWAMFTYFPSVNEIYWGIVPGSDERGPPMWWYGWMANAAVVGLVCAVLSFVVPEKALGKLWLTLAWATPVAAMIYLGWVERVWFGL